VKRTRTLVLSSLVASGLVVMMAGAARLRAVSASAGQAAPQEQPAPAAPAGRGNFLNNFTGNITVGNTKET
jgi:hypothetical protein